MIALAASAAGAGCYEDWQTADLDSDWHAIEAGCVQTILEDLEILFPDRIEAVALGRGAAGRMIWGARLTEDVRSLPPMARPSLVLLGGTHSNERGSLRTVLDWVNHLLSNPEAPAYPAGPPIGQLLAETEVWVLPSQNADQDGRCNPNHVNLNRDMDFRWELSVGAGAPFGIDHCDTSGATADTGLTPRSQPESHAIAGLFKRAQPSVFVDVHWAKTPARLPDPAVDPPSVVAGCALVQDSAGLNYVVVRNRVAYNWDGTEYQNSGASRGLDARYLTDATNPLSLPRLAEGTSSRLYGPYSSADVCDQRDGAPYTPPDGGTTAGGDGQIHGWAWVAEGAVSINHELLLGDPLVDREAFAYWGRPVPERDVQVVSADLRAPLGRLLELTPNPTPGSGSTLDLKVEALYAPNGECNALDTFWPSNNPLAVPGDEFRNGQYGSYEPTCRIRNWGDTDFSGPGEVWLRIVDHTEPSATRGNRRTLSALASGQSVDHSFGTFAFEQGHDYTVECRITDDNGEESETVQTIEVTNDPGCAATGGVGEHCRAVAGGGYNALFRTNNSKWIKLRAVQPEDRLCRNGVRRPAGVTGSPAAYFLPAVL